MQSKKGEIRKSKRLCEIKLASIIKVSKKFFKYFSNNKKQKSSIVPLNEEGEIITIDIEIAEMLNLALFLHYRILIMLLILTCHIGKR